jgi:hypothetical protein
MATTNYNSFPQAPELMLVDGADAAADAGPLRLIRRKQELAQMWANEVAVLGAQERPSLAGFGGRTLNGPALLSGHKHSYF